MRIIYIITASSFILLIFGGLNIVLVFFASVGSLCMGSLSALEIADTKDPRQYEGAPEVVWFVLTFLNVTMYSYTCVLFLTLWPPTSFV